MKYFFFVLVIVATQQTLVAQNVGIGTTTPNGKLHIAGNADISQLVIDAHTNQSNTKPLLKFRNANGVDILGLHTDSEYNLFVGINAGRSNVVNITTGSGLYNTFIGSGTGYYNSSGYFNTALGRNSLFQNTSGNSNTSVGFKSLFSNTYGDLNTALGSESLLSNISGFENTAIGNKALYLNTAGNYNTAIGTHALYSNSTAVNNTAIGRNALYTQSYSNSGSVWYSNNTAVGTLALASNQPTSTTNGKDNTAVGASSLQDNTTGSQNTAVGVSSLQENTTGSQNTAVGNEALYSNTIGFDNTANGYQALHSNTNGSYNNASGYQALYSNTTGFFNTAIGTEAISNNTTGSGNTGIGDQALYSNVTGSYNSASGKTALTNNTTGSFNTAVGYQSLMASATGNNNTAVGNKALDKLTGGYQNIAIGWGSGTHAAAANVYNTISIGNDGFLNAYQNQAFIGNLSTAWIGGQVNWATYSDARIKTTITEDVKGLDFITRLRPVTYNKSFAAITKLTGNAETENFPGKYDGEQIRYSGFLAQEVEAAAKQSDYNFSGLHKPKGEFDLYSLSYAEFVVPLVKAVQEQQQLIQIQAQTIDGLKKENEETKMRLQKLEGLVTSKQ